MDITSKGFKLAVDCQRHKQGLTQQDLATKTGISRTLMLGRIAKVDKTGSLELVYMIAEALGIPASVLLAEAEHGTDTIDRLEKAQQRRQKV